MPDLVFDVGVFDGEDSTYYLARGFRVVGIEANPIMAARVRQRLAEPIRDGRFELLNVGISAEAVPTEFWVSDVPEWSSFSHANASRNGVAATPILVNTITFRDILERYGVPTYLKVDIELLDQACLEALDPRNLPTFLSCEAGDNALDLLALMHRHGYNRFKYIDQRDFAAVSLAHVYLPNSLIRLKAKFRREIFPICREGWRFKYGSSGPFGNSTQGSWRSYEEMKHLLTSYLGVAKASNFFGYTAWFDLHATIR